MPAHVFRFSVSARNTLAGYNVWRGLAQALLLFSTLAKRASTSTAPHFPPRRRPPSGEPSPSYSARAPALSYNLITRKAARRAPAEPPARSDIYQIFRHQKLLASGNYISAQGRRQRRRIDETGRQGGSGHGRENGGGIFDFFCCSAGVSFRARGLPVDGTINGRDTGFFWIGNFGISQCLRASRERWKRSGEEVMGASSGNR